MTKIGNLYVKIAIIVIFTIYSVVKLILNSKKVDFAYKMTKRVADLDGLCINIYSIYVASVAVNGVAIIFATLMIIFWILKIVMNVLSYVIINEFNVLELCVIEDITSIAKWSDQIAIRLDQKPYFEFSAETPEIVKQIEAKANKEQKQIVKKSIKNTIDESYLEIIEEIDVNKDGEIDFSEFVTKSLQIKDVYLKKDRFYHNIFADKYSSVEIGNFINKGLIKCGLPEIEICSYCDKIVVDNEEYANIINKVTSFDDFKSIDKNMQLRVFC